MGDFDLDKTEKPDGVPCTIYRLCKELESENKESKGYTYNALLKKFHDKSGSGIIDHLKNDLHFDVDKYEDFSKCQFLKLIEYSCAMKSHFREFGNQMSGSGNHLCNYASLLA